MFIDQYPPASIMKFGFVSSPRWSTSITAVANGGERRNRNWQHPLHSFSAPEAVECHEHLAALHNMWMATAGPLHTFPFRDPLDFASRDLPAADVEPPIGPTDQVIGIGDGSRRSFAAPSHAPSSVEVEWGPTAPAVSAAVTASGGVPSWT